MTPVEIIEKYNESNPLGPVLLYSEEWQTLKTAVLAQQTTNSQSKTVTIGCTCGNRMATVHLCDECFRDAVTA